MDLKLKDNLLFSLGSTISSSITSSCTTAYVKDCPNVSGIGILRQCSNLTRVRLDIGSVSGSLTELLSYSTLNGFNDNYEPQVKPRLVGTWTVNNWYLPEQLTQAQVAFDGLTVIGDSSKEIVFNDLAIQTLDDTKSNYNPAVAIVLQGQSKGTTITNPIISGKGRWFLTKTQAAAITSLTNGMFSNKNTVTDTNGIVSSDNTATYDFESFDELQYFTGITSIPLQFCYQAGNLVSIILPNTINTISAYAFYRTYKLANINIPSGIVTIQGDAFNGAGSNATNPITVDIDLPNLTTLNSSAFYCCKLIRDIIDLGNVTILTNQFYMSSVRKANIPLITEIGNSCFYGAAGGGNLEEVIFGNNLTKIGKDCFNSQKHLKTFTIPTSVTEIGEHAFNSVGSAETFEPTDLKSINLPNLSVLGKNVFVSCAWLKSVESLGSISSVNVQVFGYCTNLKKVVFPSTVTSMAVYIIWGSSNCIVILNSSTPPTINSVSGSFNGVSYYYVGEGESATDDNAVLQAYRADSKWGVLTNIDTYYNYLHPTT